jgi:hypothetical protein
MAGFVQAVGEGKDIVSAAEEGVLYENSELSQD